MELPQGLEKWCRLPNTSHSEIAPTLSLPSLPVCCGAPDQTLRLSDEPADRVPPPAERPEILAHAGMIARLLGDCDVSYLKLKEEASGTPGELGECSSLYSEVLKHNPEAFKCSTRGPFQERSLCHSVSEKKHFEQTVVLVGEAQGHYKPVPNEYLVENVKHDPPASIGLRKPKVKKKENEFASPSTVSDVPDQQDIAGNFCEMVEDFCGRAEMLDDLNGSEGLSLPLADIKMLVNEIMSVRAKKVLQLIPLDTLVRLLNVLDRQIQGGQGLSINADEKSDADSESLVFSALESTHAALAIMAYGDMPKQLYKEEVIERIVDFSRYQIMACMSAFSPSYRPPHKPSENGRFDGDEDEDDDIDTSKKRRNVRNSNMKKSAGIKVSSAVNSVVQKLCSILLFLKDLLLVERLSDSCILQLVKTCFETFLVDTAHILQLKSINLISGVFSSYRQHRNFLIDDTVHLLWKLQVSKRAVRGYHLPEDEQKQIQMITALLIQLVQFSANPPEMLNSTTSWNTILDASIDTSYPTKCHEATTEVCCHFWTNVLQRFATAKSQEVPEYKVVLENLVMDLLTVLNLPEYPASGPILEVLCVFLLQNAGLKSKDITVRGIAIDILGTIAARLKRDAVICSKDNLWILQELVDGDNKVSTDRKDECSVCYSGKCLNIKCHVCHRCFHSDCAGVAGEEMLLRDWSCLICLCRKQLSLLKSHCKPQSKEVGKKNTGSTGKACGASDSVTALEVIQQIFLNYLQETGLQDDANLFTRWLYLCLWYKDDPLSQEKIIYHLVRLKSKAILRETGTNLLLSRDWAKRICLTLGQKSSFSRGFDKILSLLLASLRENSPILRAKALRAVSAIVEADPEVLCDKRVQCAVEGRFCDSAISVREAALELVGRHIASHPDVGLKYFEKVAERIKDTGVSVRKRAIKIIRDLCISTSNFSELTNAFIEIISRVSDEESSIQELVCKTFFEFWFEEPSGSQTQFVGDGSSVPVEVAKKTEQIVDVLRKMSSHNLLVIIIKRNLKLDFLPQSAKASGISAVSLASVRKRCELICKRLLERILQVEEGNSGQEEVRALPYVMALHAFCVVDPQLCAPATDPSQFVVTLQPYLKNQVDNKAIAQLLESIIFVIDAVLPLLRKPPHSVIEELEQDMKHMIMRHSFLTVVHSCIKCLCSLSKLSGKGANLVEYLIQIFFKHLHGPSGDNKQLLGRSLFCLGLLIRYGNELVVISKNQPLQVNTSLILLKKYLLMEDFSLKVRALQALGYILIARPEYMLEKDVMHILEASLSSDSDARLKMQALQNLYEYLLDAEIQLGSDGANKTATQYPEDTRSGVPVAAGAGDTNICGGIIQLYWNNILERCLDVNDQVRQSALKIVEIVLRQGLVHPITSVPCLVALETDPQEVNSKLAHHLLMNMNEKYPAFFESRLGDGLQLSFRFFQSITGNRIMELGNMRKKSDLGSLASVRPGICRIYRLIRGNRVSRNKFMHSIVRKFESDSSNCASIPFLVYCTEILASLPFTCPDEPLYLIYDINRVMQLRAGTLEANLKSWSNFCQQQNISRMSKENHETKEASALHCISERNVMETIAASNESCGTTKEDMLKFQADCHGALALQLLIKLKRYLKIVYGLTDARCQSFSLKEHPKPGETISKQNIPFSIGDTPINLPNTFQDMVGKYQEFKALLREDTMDYTTYTADIKRKRPTPRSVRSGKAVQEKMGDDEDDDADEDWTGGARRLSFSSAQKSVVGGRVTRQRMQV